MTGNFKPITENELMHFCKEAGLTIRETEIIFMRTFEQVFMRIASYRELAKTFNVSPARIIMIERAAKRKLEKVIEKREVK